MKTRSKQKERHLHESKIQLKDLQKAKNTGFGCIVSADGLAQRASVCSRYSSSVSVQIIKNNNEREVFYARALGTDTAPELQKLSGPSAATFALLLICNWDPHLALRLCLTIFRPLPFKSRGFFL